MDVDCIERDEMSNIDIYATKSQTYMLGANKCRRKLPNVYIKYSFGKFK